MKPTPLLLIAAFVLTAVPCGFSAVQASAQTTGNVAGRVTDAASTQALGGASVAIRAASNDAIVAGAVSEADGTFSVESVPTGSYVLTVTFVGYQEVRVPFELTANETETINVALPPGGIDLNTVVVSASRQQEKVLDAPASISVIDTEEIEREISTNPAEVLRNTPAVDVAQTGLDRRAIVLRGFNSEFSGAVYTMTDYRPAAVPALAVNVYSLMPIPSLDLDRIEVVRGPGSALYGAGVDAGVIHFLTKDPFTHPGTTLAISGGERSYFTGQLRHAGVINSRFGYKITGAYAQGDDWELGTDDVDSLGLYPGERFVRDNDYQKLNVAGSLEYRFSPVSSLTANFGHSAVTSTILTGVGTAQADGFGYTFGQLRYTNGGFFAQGTLNRNNSGDSFLYGRVDENGNPEALVDNSIMATLQAQQVLNLMNGREEVVVGADFNLISPDTDGTIYGRNEDDDQIQEIGAYVQSTTAVTPKLDVVAALRGDYVNTLDEFALSPRAALVFKPTPEHTLRATYNRAFSAPSARTLFLDIRAQERTIAGPYSLVFQGRGPADGFTFQNFRNNGTASFILPVPLPTGGTLFGAPIPVGQIPLQPLYGAFVSGASELLLSNAPLPGPLAGLNPQQRAALAQLLAQLIPNVQGATAGQLGIPDDSDLGYRAVSGPSDIDPLEPTITNSFEVGYKGVISNRVLVAVDGYYTKKKNFIGPLLVESPLVYLPSLGNDLATALTPVLQGAAAQDPQLAGFLQSMGLTPAQAAALVGGLAASSDLGRNPVAVVQPDQQVLEPGAPSTEVGGFLSYRSFGDVDLWGIDLMMQVIATDELTLFANASIVSDDFFDADELGEDDENLMLALNASKLKVKAGFDYAFPMGLSVGASGRYIEGFPVFSGPYIGDIENYFLLDLAAGYEFGSSAPGLRLDVMVHNVLDKEHREFIGAPELGRLALARVLYSF
ncbi:MAG TPA: TonB-dependent receptor [Rhodothermales bacterium]